MHRYEVTFKLDKGTLRFSFEANDPKTALGLLRVYIAENNLINCPFKFVQIGI